MDSAFHREEEFQDTQRGKFPREWKILRFNRLLSLEYGKGLPEQKRMLGMYPVVGSNGVIGYHSRALVRGPGIVIGRKGTIGAVTWIDSDFWPIDTTYYVKVTSSDVDLKWLFYELVHLNLSKLSLADVVPGLKRELANNLVIPHPPLSEQRAIVGVLGVVDSAIQKTGEVIAKTERLKKGLMQTLLTRGIGHKEYKDTPIGRTPKTWQIVRLGEVLELCQYGLSTRFGETGKYHILKMDDIVNGAAIPDNAKYINLDERTFDNFKLEKGDILFNRTNSYELVGRTGIFLLDGDYTFASYLIRLRPKKETIDSQFLTYYMVFSNNRLRQLATRAVHQANINATNLQSFTIPVPPLPEQKQIAATLMTSDKKLEFERKEKAKFERIKRGLMDLLLTGKIRVKVD